MKQELSKSRKPADFALHVILWCLSHAIENYISLIVFLNHIYLTLRRHTVMSCGTFIQYLLWSFRFFVPSPLTAESRLFMSGMIK